jgi:hypothetical protein
VPSELFVPGALQVLRRHVGAAEGAQPEADEGRLCRHHQRRVRRHVELGELLERPEVAAELLIERVEHGGRRVRAEQRLAPAERRRVLHERAARAREQRGFEVFR